MNRALLLCLLWSQLTLSPAFAAFYQWSDASGTVHFTDDRDKIPHRYRQKARKLRLTEEPPLGAGAGSAPSSPSPPEKGAEPSAGGHPESWWRARYASLRGGLKSLSDAQPGKEEKLLELRHRRTVFQKGSDREAMNALKDEIAADEEHIQELTDQLKRLDDEASRAGVPADWRR